ncbi:MAG: ankyrin repeat domain-containing protein [Sphingobacteriia bacterium]|nr:ankyrin repeat domain-containing protein [Sphingobacteriia bacterium]NCC38862.1 ankyrin repeat domain-containing protein [Gammaproteobacteria bacterium]
MNRRPLLITAILLPILIAACGQGDPGQRTEALLESAEQGDVSTLDALLKRAATVDVRDHCDWTPLMKAALNGHHTVVERLIAAGADVDAVDNGGYTAMMLAASNDHVEILELLLNQGAMVDHQESTKGWTALIWAAGKGNGRSVETLLRHGADRTLKDFGGERAADHARTAGHGDILEQLEGALDVPRA